MMAQQRKISWNEFLMDSDGEFSFKRVFTAIVGLMFIAYFWINMFTGIKVDDRILDTVDTILMFSIGALAIEPFTKRRTTTIVSKDAVVTQQGAPLSPTAVSKAVEKLVEKTTEKVLDPPTETMPELLE